MNIPLQPLNSEAQGAHQWQNTLHTWLMIIGSALLMGLIAYSVLGGSGVVWAMILTAFGLWLAGQRVTENGPETL